MILLNHNLRIFIRVAEKGSITEAANELYISQPAVSKAIKILEDELNLKLFHRNKRKGLIITDIGHEIIFSAPFDTLDYQLLFTDHMIAVGTSKMLTDPVLDLNIKPERFIFCQTGHETAIIAIPIGLAANNLHDLPPVTLELN